MSNTQYAVCHLQRGSGNDSGMSCHIERKDAKGKKYVPANADAGRTHLNRELVRFPKGVSCRTEAIQHRIDTAGLRRKPDKDHPYHPDRNARADDEDCQCRQTGQLDQCQSQMAKGHLRRREPCIVRTAHGREDSPPARHHRSHCNRRAYPQEAGGREEI